MNYFVLTLLVTIGFTMAAIDPDKLSEEDLKTLTKFLEESEKEQLQKAKTYIPNQMAKPRKGNI